jgi:mono/diheme cytochrome c family protein
MAINKACRAFLIVTICLAASPAIAQNIVAGQAISEKLCARCHAIKSGQKSKHALAPTFPAIANRYSVWGLQEALAEGIIVGHVDMPKFVFSPTDINNLLAYMDTFTRKNGQSQ